MLAIGAHDLLGDITAVETVIGGIDGLFAAPAGSQRRGFGFHQFLQRPEQIGLAKDFAGAGRGTRLRVVRVQMRQEYPLRVRPLRQGVAVALDVVGRRGLDRVAFGQLHRRRQHLGQAESAELRQHDHQAAWRSRRDGGQRPVFRRIEHALLPEEFGGRAGGRHAQRVDAFHFTGFRVVDQRLGLAAPGQHVPHGRGGAQHGAGGVDSVAAAHEHHRAGSRGQRLAGYRHPVLGVKHRLGSVLRLRQRTREQGSQAHQQASADERSGVVSAVWHVGLPWSSSLTDRGTTPPSAWRGCPACWSTSSSKSGRRALSIRRPANGFAEI